MPLTMRLMRVQPSRSSGQLRRRLQRRRLQVRLVVAAYLLDCLMTAVLPFEAPAMLRVFCK